MSLRQAVAQAFAATTENDVSRLLDPRGRVRRLHHAGSALVAKRCADDAARRELDKATRAAQRLRASPISTPLRVCVVVPDLVELGDGDCALVAEDLGETLASDRVNVARRLPRATVEAILGRLLSMGIEWSGFVPRNLFLRGDDLLAIDWEDARLAAAPTRPDAVTLAKWDVAWSDVYEGDPRFRDTFSPRESPEEPLDDFETTLRQLAPVTTDARIRAHGVALTLRSELYAPVTSGGITPAVWGHLADELLSSRWSVFHTAVTAWARPQLGETRYAALVSAIGRVTVERPDLWIGELLRHVDEAMPHPPGTSGLAVMTERATALAGRTGAEVATRRAEIYEAILVRLCDVVQGALDLDGLQVLLRGSLAQGLVTARSDVDFELSGPACPRGHAGAEALVVDALALFGIPSEASTGRPVEVDLGQPGSPVTRDLHEWMELRRPGSTAHDPGWLRGFLHADLADLASRQSEYERAGPEYTAKYLWFEVRAALARIVMRAVPDDPPATVSGQLALLPELIGPTDARELHAILLAVLDQRERDCADPVRCAELRTLLETFRSRHRLPGANRPESEQPFKQEMSKFEIDAVSGGVRLTKDPGVV